METDSVAVTENRDLNTEAPPLKTTFITIYPVTFYVYFKNIFVA